MSKQFILTEEEYSEVIEASKPVPYLVIGGYEPRSPQENVNTVWKRIAEKYGVDWSTIRPINENTRLMSGEEL